MLGIEWSALLANGAGSGAGLGEGRVGAPKNYSRFCKKKHLLLAKLTLKDVIQYSAKYFNRYH